MAKKALTQATYATNNIQSQPDQVKDDATALKLAFDQTGIDQKAYNNSTLLSELADETLNNSGSNTIGHSSTSVTADNVGDALEENRLLIDTNTTDIATKADDSAVVKLTGDQTVAGVKTFSSSPVIPETPTTDTQAASKGYVDTEIAGVVLGQIPDNSLTNDKLATDVKVGSLASLTTTDKSDVVSAINEINQGVTNRDTATDGQVLTSNGDGTSTYEDVEAPTDYGRYQQDYGLDDATLSGTLIDNTEIKLGSVANGNTVGASTYSTAVDIYGVNGYGQKLESSLVTGQGGIGLVSFRINAKVGVPSDLILDVVTSDNSTVIGTKTVSASEIQNTSDVDFRFDEPLDTQDSVVYLRLYQAGFSGDNSNKYTLQVSNTSVLANSVLTQTTNSWTSTTELSTQDAYFRLDFYDITTTGTADKTTTPNTPAKNYGNDKFEIGALDGSTNSVVYTVRDSGDTTDLITPITYDATADNTTHTVDLSSISTETYPSIIRRWTLNRTLTTDPTPTLDASASVTWEGTQSEVWKKIAEVTLSSTTLQIDFENLDLQNYKALKLITTAATTGNAEQARIRLNDDSGAYLTRQSYFEDGQDNTNSIDYGNTYFFLDQFVHPTDSLYFNYAEITFSNQGTQKVMTATYFSGNLISTSGRRFIEGNKELLTAITKISLYQATNGFASGSQFVLLGLI